MTHSTIDYNHYEPEEQKRRAIADCMGYLGGETEYNAIIEHLRRQANEGMSRRGLELGLSIHLGIEGYPAEVMVDVATKPNTTA